MEEIKRDAKRMKEFLQLCETLRVFVGCDWPMPCANELLQVFGKVCRYIASFNDHVLKKLYFVLHITLTSLLSVFSYFH